MSLETSEAHDPSPEEVQAARAKADAKRGAPRIPRSLQGMLVLARALSRLPRLTLPFPRSRRHRRAYRRREVYSTERIAIVGRPRRVGCVRAPVSRPPRVPHPRKVQGRDLHPFQGRRRRLIVGTREGPRVRRVRLHVPGGALPQVFGSDTAPRGRRGPRQRRGQGALRRRVSAPGHCEMRRRGKTSRAARARVRGQGSVRRGAGAGAERHSFAESGAAPRGLSSRRGSGGAPTSCWSTAPSSATSSSTRRRRGRRKFWVPGRSSSP